MDSHIRPLNTRTDLLDIANLIELCFADHMDNEGWEYVCYLRRLASRQSSLGMIGTAEFPTSMDGFVWVENNRLVGNLSMIPFSTRLQKRVLVANVAVHPDFRRRGIGKELTQTAINDAIQHGFQSIWLHVRDDNPTAYHLYAELGFHERVRRTTWQMNPGKVVPEHLEEDHRLQNRTSRDWDLQRQWLRELYPSEVIWNLPLPEEQMAPGFWNGLSRFFKEETVEHWVLRCGDELQGVLTWMATSRSYDPIWVATTREVEDQVIHELIPQALLQILSPKPLVLNYPAHRGVKAFSEIGFSLVHTLIWMEFPVPQNRDNITQLEKRL